MSDLYLVWSHEHGGWWKPGSRGYTKMLGEAGRYDRAQAIAICHHALHSGLRLGTFAEVPVREEDVLEFIRGQALAGWAIPVRPGRGTDEEDAPGNEEAS